MNTTIAGDRLVSANVFEEVLAPDGVSPSLRTTSTELIASDGDEVGLWEAGPGIDSDTEADEVFLVLTGSGTLTFEDDGSTVELRPGVLVRLRKGDRTSWDITERLRKLYLA